jgi:low temperature requirement protein LtrA
MEGGSPSLGFWTPGLGRSTTADWDVSPHHLAERCGLFVIIALGESLLVTGATFADLPWTQQNIITFAIAFAGALAMWWVYFSIAAEDASEEFSRSKDPGRIARLAYTYIHILLVAGIILAAVGDERVLAHPGGRLGFLDAAVILGGPWLFLAGNLLFKGVLFEEVPRSHVAGLALLTSLIITIPFITPLALSGIATLILLVVGVWENVYVSRWKAANPK